MGHELRVRGYETHYKQHILSKMKLLTILLLLPVLLTGSYQGCDKEQLISEQEFEVKVVASFCAFTIVEIKDPLFYELGTDWKEYKNVFTVANPCDLPESLQIGATYRCRIIQKAEKDGCIQCEGFMETPSLSRLVKLSQ